MNCLIIAAGHGSRLRGMSSSKPLTPVGGIPLIEHVIARAAEGGATNFHVVTGHEAERVETFLAGLAGRLGIAVRAIRAADWDLPNGHSVVAGAEAIEGDYLLLMADHLFDPEIVRRLLRASRSGIGLRLAVDRRLSGPLLDLEDATKVEVAGDGAIIRIGKELERFNAIDTGIFLATPALAAAIRDTADGDGSLSGGVRLLARQGRAQTIDIDGLTWIDVDDPQRLGLAEALVARQDVSGTGLA